MEPNNNELNNDELNNNEPVNNEPVNNEPYIIEPKNIEPEKPRMPSKSMLILRFVIAGYLIYLSYDLATGYFNAPADKTTTMPAWAMIVFVVLFSVVGLFVGIATIIALVKGRFRGGKGEIK